jgi:hypothetical protein
MVEVCWGTLGRDGNHQPPWVNCPHGCQLFISSAATWYIHYLLGCNSFPKIYCHTQCEDGHFWHFSLCCSADLWHCSPPPRAVFNGMMYTPALGEWHFLKTTTKYLEGNRALPTPKVQEVGGSIFTAHKNRVWGRFAKWENTFRTQLIQIKTGSGQISLKRVVYKYPKKDKTL